MTDISQFFSVGEIQDSLRQQQDQQTSENDIFQSIRLQNLDQSYLNILYSIVNRMDCPDWVDIAKKVNFLKKLEDWLDDGASRAGQLKVSNRTLHQILELILLMMKEMLGYTRNNDQMLISIEMVISLLFTVLEQSEDDPIRLTLVQCIAKIFQLKPQIINYKIYAGLLAATYQKFEQFYDFIKFYFSPKNINGIQLGIMKEILKGFERRMNYYSEKPYLSTTEKIFINKCYLILVKQLNQKTNTNIPEIVFNDHGKIFDYLRKFVRRQFNASALSDIYNILIEVYMISKMNNIDKFKFVLGIYKYIIQSSSLIFSFLKTEQLVSPAFQDWLFETEITRARAEEVRTFYFKNSYSLEFLLLMAIYYIDIFPQNIYRIASFMRNINLLEDTVSLFNQNIQYYMELFHEQTQDGEYFRQFMASVDPIQLA